MRIKSVLTAIAMFAFVFSIQAADLTGSYFLRFETGFAAATDPGFNSLDLVNAGLGNTMYFGIGGGYQVFEKLRSDLTLTYRGGWEQSIQLANAVSGKGNFSSTAVMWNLNYEFDPWHEIMPFAGIGLGYVHNHLDRVALVSGDGSPLASINGGGWSNFGFQFGGGITVVLAEQWMVDLGYRYFDGGKYETDDVVHFANGNNVVFSKHVGDLSAHDLTISLRYRFP